MVWKWKNTHPQDASHDPYATVDRELWVDGQKKHKSSGDKINDKRGKPSASLIPQIYRLKVVS